MPRGTGGVRRRIQGVLDWAAIEAVSRWRYTPTLLNGVPVPCVVTIMLNYKLR